MFVEQNGRTYTFQEHDFVVTGEEQHLRAFVEIVRQSSAEDTTISDIAFSIERFFNIDGLGDDKQEDRRAG